MVFMPTVLPSPALRPYVMHYLLLHIQLKGVPDHQRIKPIPPDAEQSLFFYPRSPVNTIVNSTGAVRQSGSSVFVGQQTSRINIQFGEDHLIIQVCFRPGFLYQFLGKMPISTFQAKEINAELLSDAGIKELNEQLQEETDHWKMLGLIDGYLVRKLAKIPTDNQPIDRAIAALKGSEKTAFAGLAGRPGLPE